MKNKLLKILDNFKGKKILVIGDIMLDKYIWGDVSRISPEAPVQVVNVLKETYEAGGAANVANNVAALGGLPYMVGISGNDEARNVLMEEMRKKCINTGGIIQDKDKPTTQKVRIIGKSQQLLMVDYENKEHIHHDIENSIIKFAEKNINEVDVVVISDYAKGVITQEVSSKIISLAKQNKKQVIVDPKPKHRNWYIGVDLITPNNNEASEMSGCSPNCFWHYSCARHAKNIFLFSNKMFPPQLFYIVRKLCSIWTIIPCARKTAVNFRTRKNKTTPFTQ